MIHLAYIPILLTDINFKGKPYKLFNYQCCAGTYILWIGYSHSDNKNVRLVLKFMIVMKTSIKNHIKSQIQQKYCDSL